VGAILAELGDDKELLGKETCGLNVQLCWSKDMMSSRWERFPSTQRLYRRFLLSI
jgi:hypothetical protein